MHNDKDAKVPVRKFILTWSRPWFGLSLSLIVYDLNVYTDSSFKVSNHQIDHQYTITHSSEYSPVHWIWLLTMMLALLYFPQFYCSVACLISVFYCDYGVLLFTIIVFWREVPTYNQEIRGMGYTGVLPFVYHALQVYSDRNSYRPTQANKKSTSHWKFFFW